MISVRGLALDTIGDVQFRGASLEEIGEVHVRDASGPSLVWSRSSAMTATIPDIAYGYGYSAGSAFITSEVVTVSVTGGTPPYSYIWEGITDAELWDIIIPALGSARFRASVGPDDALVATFKVTVSDSLGASVESGEVTVTLTNVWG